MIPNAYELMRRQTVASRAKKERRRLDKLFPEKDKEQEEMAWSPKTLPDDDPWILFAKVHFTDSQAANFSRKDLRKPLFDLTPETDRKEALALWTVIQRFMGDQVDLRGDIEPAKSHQPDQGSVMSRLYNKLGVSQNERDLRRSAQMDQQNGNCKKDLSEEFASTLVMKTKRGGTLRRLKATLTRRMFEPRQHTVFDSLPLEESLMTHLDQMHFIVGYGILKPSLRDEIMCQICKQLIKNPYKSSLSRGWLLLSLCFGCFSPSPSVYKVFETFCEHGPPYYSAVCKKLLKRTLDNGCRFQPPSLMELEAGLQKKLLELQVTFMDGTQQSVMVDAATTSRELCVRLAKGLGLRETFGFSIYIAMHAKVASLGNGSDHLFDSISQCEQIFREKERVQSLAPWRLFYRKEMFSPWDHFSHDTIATNLVYAQLVRGLMLGEYQCEKDVDLAVLSAQQYYIDYGAHLSNEGLNTVLPSYIPPERRAELDSLKSWKKVVVKAFKKLFSDKETDPSPDSVKADIVRYGKTQWALHFSRFYDVRKLEGRHDWPDDQIITLAVNWLGVTLVHHGKPIYKMSYPEISGILDSDQDPAQTITIRKVNGAVFKFSSSDADDIRHIITFMMDGLRQRSRYGITLTSNKDEGTQDLVYVEGDVIEMAKLEPSANIKDVKTRRGKNTRTGESGEFNMEEMHIIPIIGKPTTDTLNIFFQRSSEG